MGWVEVLRRKFYYEQQKIANHYRAPTFKEFAGDFIVRLKAFMIQILSYAYLKDLYIL